MTAFLDDLLTPCQVVDAVKTSTGVNISERAVRKRARDRGLTCAIGRNIFIQESKLPELFEQEIGQSQQKSQDAPTPKTKHTTTISQSKAPDIGDLRMKLQKGMRKG